MSHPAAPDKWGLYKDEIYALYILEDLPLEGPHGVMEVMRQRFGFNASKAQYGSWFKTWDFRKYIKGTRPRDFQIALRKFEAAKARLANTGEEPRVYYRGKPLTAKVLKRRGYLTYVERSALEQAPSPQTPPEFSICIPSSSPTANTDSPISSKDEDLPSSPGYSPPTHNTDFVSGQGFLHSPEPIYVIPDYPLDSLELRPPQPVFDEDLSSHDITFRLDWAFTPIPAPSPPTQHAELPGLAFIGESTHLEDIGPPMAASVSATPMATWDKNNIENQLRVENLSTVLNSMKEPDNIGHEPVAYSPEQASRVDCVLKTQTCLRCKLLGLQCSSNGTGSIPCRICLSLATQGHENNIPFYSYCIRSHFRDINIFYCEFLSINETSVKTAKIDSRVAVLDFAVAWDINSLVQLTFDWISNSADWGISLVGTFSSHQFLQLIGNLLGGTLSRNFRRLIYSTSLAHTRRHSLQDDAFMTVEDLHQVSYVAGCDLINSLDDLLSPQSLEKSDMQRIKVLFLFVFGIILGIGYSNRLTDSPLFPDNSKDSPTAHNNRTLWDVMQEHLSQMLGHYLVFLGSRIGFRFNPYVERRLLTMSVCNWLPEGNFTWSERKWLNQRHNISRLESICKPAVLGTSMREASYCWSKCDVTNARRLHAESRTQEKEEYLAERRSLRQGERKRVRHREAGLEAGLEAVFECGGQYCMAVRQGVI